MKVKELLNNDDVKSYYGRKVIITSIYDDEDWLVGVEGKLCSAWKEQETFEQYGVRPVCGIESFVDGGIINLFEEDEIEFLGEEEI